MKVSRISCLLAIILAQGCCGQNQNQPQQGQQGSNQPQQQQGQQQQQQQQQPNQQQPFGQQGPYGSQQPLLFFPNYNPVQSIVNPFIHLATAGAHGIMEVGKNIFEFPLTLLKTGQVYVTSALNSFASPQWVPPQPPSESPLLELLNRLTSSTTTTTTTTTTTPRPRPGVGG